MRFTCTKYAIIVIGLQVIGLLDGLQLSNATVSPALDLQLVVRFAIIQVMRFFYTKYAVVSSPVVSSLEGLQSSEGLPVVGLSDGLQSLKGCISPISTTAFGVLVVGLPVVGSLDGLQSFNSVSLHLQLSKGYALTALSVQLLIYELFTYQTMHDYLKNTFLLHRLSA